MAGQPGGARERGEGSRPDHARGRNPARRRRACARRPCRSGHAARSGVRSALPGSARGVRAGVLRASPRARERQHVARRRALGTGAHAPLPETQSARVAGRTARGELGLFGFWHALRSLLAVAALVDLAAPRALIAFSHGGDYTVSSSYARYGASHFSASPTPRPERRA